MAGDVIAEFVQARIVSPSRKCDKWNVLWFDAPRREPHDAERRATNAIHFLATLIVCWTVTGRPPTSVRVTVSVRVGVDSPLPLVWNVIPYRKC